MSLKTYTLLVSLAAVIGLLVTIAPLLRSALEYKSPESVEPRTELASLEAFVLARNTGGMEDVLKARHLAATSGTSLIETWDRATWQAMYDAAKTQHIQGTRSRRLLKRFVVPPSGGILTGIIFETIRNGATYEVIAVRDSA
jgi:hypothetical protein